MGRSPLGDSWGSPLGLVEVGGEGESKGVKRRGRGERGGCVRRGEGGGGVRVC